MNHGFFRLPVFAILALLSTQVFADTNIGSVAGKIATEDAAPMISLLYGICYLTGAVFGIKSLLQLLENGKGNSQVKLSAGITSAAICSLLLTMPTFIDSLNESFGLSGGDSSLNVPGPVRDLVGIMMNGSPAGAQAKACGSGQGVAQSAASSPGGAATGASIDQMACAFSYSIPGLMFLIFISGYVAGLYLLFKSVLMLKEVNEGRTPLSKALWTMLSGFGLWAIFPMLTTVFSTMGADAATTSILTQKYYEISGGSDAFSNSIKADLYFVQLLGAIAFFRGILMLKSMGENKDGTMGRALTHIFGGAAALNINWTLAMLATSIGAKTTICNLATNICAF